MKSARSWWSGQHQTIVWLTPPHVQEAIGGWQSFDLDPCAAPDPRPWPTAKRMNGIEDGDGLALEWDGRVWLNMPYDAVTKWTRKLVAHGKGTSLIFMDASTACWHDEVWPTAEALYFIRGRLAFLQPDGTPRLDKNNRVQRAGSASVLCAYGQEDVDRLAAISREELDGTFQLLRAPRFMVVSAMLDRSWRDAVINWMRQQNGPVNVADAYRAFANHPKARRNRHWQAKVRQQLQRVGQRTGRAQYELSHV